MKRPPLAVGTYQKINDTITTALRREPAIGGLIRRARQAIKAEEPDVDGFLDALVEAGALLSRTEAGSLLTREECDRYVFMFATIQFPTDDTGTPQPVHVDMRVTRLPGIEERPLWVLIDQADAAALAKYLAPGQVWVRADLLRSDDWATVRAVASDASGQMLGKVRRPGRRPGSTNKVRTELLDRIRANPSMTDDEIDRLGVEADIWMAASGDYDLKRRRISRARADAAGHTSQ